MTAPDRAATLAVWRLVLDIAEASPEFPLPSLRASDSSVHFVLYGYRDAAPGLLAAIEAALPCEMARLTVTADERYTLAGEIGGVLVEIDAHAPDVAERKVTGTRTKVIEDVQWVRKPAAASEEPQEPAAEGGQ